MSTLDKNPSNEQVQTFFRKAEELERQSQHQQAHQIYKQIIRAKPNWPFAYYGLATTLIATGNFEDARRNLIKAIQLKENRAPFHHQLAEVHNRLDDLENAIKSIDRAIELEPTNTDYLVAKAYIYLINGHPQTAYDLLDPVAQSTKPTDQLLRVYASLCGSMGDPQRGIDALEPRTAEINPDPMITATNLFVLAKLLDQTAQYDKAYAAATRASELRADVYHIEERTKRVEDRIAAWTKDRLARLPRSRVNSSKPVFIVGMPRSGTTLIEQIIASHHECYGAGELIGILNADFHLSTPLPAQDLADHLDELKAPTIDREARKVLKAMEKQVPKGEKPTRITDKLPMNFQHIGLIELLFPNARIIHCQRHVLDTFISSYLLDFAGLNNLAYTYNPVHFAHAYALYLRQMEHWKKVSSLPILEISYEEIIADQRGMTEQIVSFLDLEWDDACMRFFERKRAVNTASTEQVRKAMYSSSMARWKNYDGCLDAVKEALTAHGVKWQPE